MSLRGKFFYHWKRTHHGKKSCPSRQVILVYTEIDMKNITKLIFFMNFFIMDLAAAQGYCGDGRKVLPLDMRVFLDGKPVTGKLEISKQLIGRNIRSYSELYSVIEPHVISAKRGQKFRLGVEVSEPDENTWRDVTLDRRLLVSSEREHILFDVEKEEISISSSCLTADSGAAAEGLSIYYTEVPQDCHAVQTAIYFDIKE